MINYTEIKSLFENIGGTFVASPMQISQKLSNIKAFVFDWDGVFNSGIKGSGISSTYSEADSMGTNLLRYAFWLPQKTSLFTAIISGASNPTALELAKREHFTAVYLKIIDKKEALDHFCALHQLDIQEIAYCFDDANDFPIAKDCGLRFLINRKASPLFLNFAKKHKLCDYITAQEGGNHAVRELAELSIGLKGLYGQVVQSRMDYDPTYQMYFKERQDSEMTHFEKTTEGFKIV